MKVMVNKKVEALVRAWKRVKRWVKKHPWPSFLIATLLLAGMIHLYLALFVPPSREHVWKEVEVAPGMSFKAIAASLEREGLVRSRRTFEVFGRLQGITRRVRVGYYGLSTDMSMWKVLETLRTGRVIEYEVVVPEGYNLYQIGYALAGTPLISDPQQFISKATNRDFAKGLGIEADRLEGYLFPDTYYFPKGTKLEDIAKRMVQRYREVFVDSYRARADELGFTEHQVVTLASIIEKEAKVPTERSLISSVYHNRLRIGMKLQADPTAVYGTKAWITNVTKKDLQRRSPYNTYLHKGLPPGPIANPGQGSILAALYPENVDYLFFVAQGDGSHYFSKEYGDHTRAVNRYRAVKRNANRTNAVLRSAKPKERPARPTP